MGRINIWIMKLRPTVKYSRIGDLMNSPARGNVPTKSAHITRTQYPLQFHGRIVPVILNKETTISNTKPDSQFNSRGLWNAL